MSDNVNFLFFDGLKYCTYDDFMDSFEERSDKEFHEMLRYHGEPTPNKDGICYVPVSLKDESEWRLSHKKPRQKVNKEYVLPPVASSDQLGFHCNFPEEDAVFDKVIPGGILDKIGIEPADRIHTVNGQRVSTMEQAIKAILTSESSNVDIGVYKEDGTYRNDDNVKTVNGLVMDLDEEGALEQAKRLFEGYNYTYHSTHSYTKDTPYKFRMFISLDEPVSADFWPSCFASVAAAVGVDRSCGNLSRVYFFPSHSPDAGIEPFAEHCSGKKLSLDDIMAIGRRHNVDLSDIKSRSDRRFDMPTEFNYVHGTVSQYYRKAKPKCDLTSMENRFMQYMDDLKSSRNSFVKSVIDFEIFSHGEKTDLEQLVNFCVLKASNPELTPYCKNSFDQGDTPSDIIDLIETAVHQNSSREIFKSMYPDMKDQLEAMVNSAIVKASIPGLLEAEFPLSDEMKKRVLISQNLDFSYEDIKARHTEMIDKLQSGEIDRRQYVETVVKSEISQNGPGKLVNLKHFVQFLYRSTAEYSDRSLDTGAVADKIGEIFQKHANEVVPGTYKFKNVAGLVSKQCREAHEKVKDNSWDVWKSPKAAAPSDGAGMQP